MEKVIGYTEYKGTRLQQHQDYQAPFIKLLTELKPKRILEIGTGYGGLILFLRDKLNEIGLEDTLIKSFDINHTYFDLPNLEFIKENLFIDDFKLDRYDLIEDFIKSDGITIVLCDGGNKIKEFNQIAPLLKTGDILMAHDYVDTMELFENEYKDKIWNWCEITRQDIEQITQLENLIDYMKEDFNKIVWVCKMKN